MNNLKLLIVLAVVSLWLYHFTFTDIIIAVVGAIVIFFIGLLFLNSVYLLERGRRYTQISKEQADKIKDYSEQQQHIKDELQKCKAK
jgi:hypothetical protein